MIIPNIWAAGRNYADHAKEMNAVVPTVPVIFLKAGSSATTSSLIELPKWSKEVHFETEIAFWLNEDLKFSHMTLALDLTARDAQSEAKKNGLPWTLAKSFAGACPLGPWIALDSLPKLESLEFEMKVNGESRQLGHFTDMIFAPENLLNYIKNHFPVAPHDVILTGTPSGVGALKSGDKLEAILRDKTASKSQSSKSPILVCHWDVE